MHVDCGRGSVIFWRGAAMCYVFPVFWVTSGFHAVGAIARCLQQQLSGESVTA